MTGLCMNCCCDTYPTRQWLSIANASGADLVDEGGLPTSLMTSCEFRVLSRARAPFPSPDNASDRVPISSNDLQEVRSRWAIGAGHATNLASRDLLSTSSRLTPEFTFVEVSSNFSDRGMRSLSLPFTSMHSKSAIVDEIEGRLMRTRVVLLGQLPDGTRYRVQAEDRGRNFLR